LATERSYKAALTPRECMEIMYLEAEKGLWDQSLVREFFNMMGQAQKVA